ncbi:MAG: hypothetical protein LBD59_06255 [Prevotellaceae bacterium]|jgi:beta-lactamase regulating signal transducer with metallopeptidase domain|nr:hypothetical protein [Prevotellaceae bacterium]
MKTILQYLFESLACSSIFAMYYLCFLRNGKFLNFNRAYLLLTTLAAVLIPLVHITYHIEVPVTIQTQAVSSVPTSATETFGTSTETFGTSTETLGTSTETFGTSTETLGTSTETFGTSEEMLGTSEEKKADSTTIFWIVYLLPLLWLLGMEARSLLVIQRAKRKSPTVKINGVDVCTIDSGAAPFAFFNTIFWRSDIDINSDMGQRIFKHELAHVKSWHSYDKLLMQSLCAFFWINPVMRLIKRELDMIHEYAADSASVTDNNTQELSALILCSLYPERYQGLASHFFQSNIKQRINMLSKTTKPRFCRFRQLMILPVCLLVLYLFTVTIEAKYVPVVADANNVEDTAVSHSRNAYAPTADDLNSALTVSNSEDFGIEDTVITNQHSQTLATKPAITFDDEFMLPSLEGKERLIQAAIYSLEQSENFIYPKKVRTVKTPPEGERPMIVVLRDAGYNERRLDEIDQIFVMKEEAAIAKYGEEGRNGVVIFKMKNVSDRDAAIRHRILKGSKDDKSPMVVILRDSTDNGGAEIIDAFTVMKGDLAVARYGEEARNGVIIVTMKSVDSDKKIEADAQNLMKMFEDNNTSTQFASGSHATVKYDTLTNSRSITSEIIINCTKGSTPPPLVVILRDSTYKGGVEILESFSILKDKAAVDRYGEKGQNGVVIVKMKNVKADSVTQKQASRDAQILQKLIDAGNTTEVKHVPADSAASKKSNTRTSRDTTVQHHTLIGGSGKMSITVDDSKVEIIEVDNGEVNIMVHDDKGQKMHFTLIDSDAQKRALSNAEKYDSVAAKKRQKELQSQIEYLDKKLKTNLSKEERKKTQNLYNLLETMLNEAKATEAAQIAYRQQHMQQQQEREIARQQREMERQQKQMEREIAQQEREIARQQREMERQQKQMEHEIAQQQREMKQTQQQGHEASRMQTLEKRKQYQKDNPNYKEGVRYSMNCGDGSTCTVVGFDNETMKKEIKELNYPLIFLNDKEVSQEELHRALDTATIKKYTTMLGTEATRRYNEKGKDGALLVETATIQQLEQYQQQLEKQQEQVDKLLEQAEKLQEQRMTTSNPQGTKTTVTTTRTDRNGYGSTHMVIGLDPEKMKRDVKEMNYPLIYLNDKEVSQEELHRALDAATITSYTTMSGTSATDKHGDKGKDGALIVKTEKKK